MLTPDALSSKWLKAKATVELAQTTTCNGFYHFGHVHAISTIFCTAFRRHFSKIHPFYDILKSHCEGAVVHNALSYGSLLRPGDFGEMQFAVSVPGMLNFTTQAFHDRNFGQFDLPNMLKV